MRKAEHVRDAQLPQDFGAVIAESSRADLRMVSSGARFVAADRAAVTGLTGPMLIVASSPQFLAEALEALEGVDQEIWVLLSETTSQRLADMLENNDRWTITAGVMEPPRLALQLRRSTASDRSLEGVVTGLKLAGLAGSTGLERPLVLTIEPRRVEKPATLVSVVKRRIPPRMKKMIKRTLRKK